MGEAPDKLKLAIALLGQTNEETAARSTRRNAMLSWMEMVPYGIFTTDSELRIRSWNRWLETHSGLSETQVVGRPLFEVYPDLVARRLDEHFRRVLNGEVAVLSTALHRYLLPLPPVTREFGVDMMLQTARIAPLPDESSIVGTVAFVEDVTQRECQAFILRRQQEYDRLLSEVLAHLLESPDPVEATAEIFASLVGPLKLEVYFNYLLEPGSGEARLNSARGVTPEFRKALMRAGQALETPCARCITSQSPLIVSNVQTNPDPKLELVRRAGLRTYAGFPLLIGDRVLGTVSFGSYARDTIAPDEINFLSILSKHLAIAIDRSQRERALREAQASLAAHAGSLETKVAERTAKLHETIHQLESFSYTVAHDLRAPIRALSNYSEVLLSDYASEMPGPAREILLRLKRAGARLDALTRDLLHFSRIGREEIDLGPVDVSDLITSMMEDVPALSSVVSIVEPLGTVCAQRTLLEQCFSNLLDNAVKFARPGIPLAVRVSSEHKRGTEAGKGRRDSRHPFNSARIDKKPAGKRPHVSEEWIRIWVEDNGIGVPQSEHEKIFGIFERASGLDHIAGTGIGLAIVARAMQQMGGYCGVESVHGKGSRFWLELPAHCDPEPA